MEREGASTDKRLHTRRGKEEHLTYLKEKWLAAITQVLQEERKPEDLAREIAETQDVLEQERMRDSLTGAFSPAYFGATLSWYMGESTAQRHKIGLIRFDFDKFKDINDKELDCHQAGDRTLREFVRSLGGLLTPKNALIGRLGGDEFVVMLPHGDQLETITLAVKIVLKVSSDLAKLAGLQRNQVSVSAGVCIIKPGDEYMEVMRAADQAVYEAKETGGSVVLVEDLKNMSFREVYTGEPTTTK